MQNPVDAESAKVLSLLRNGFPTGSRVSLLTRVLLGLLAAVLLAALGYWFLGHGLLQSREVEARYKTVPVLRQDLRVTITATGKLAPVNQVDVGSELSGKITRVEVDFNDQVHADQLLAVGARPRQASLDAVEQAALTSVCLALLNLDEALNRE